MFQRNGTGKTVKKKREEETSTLIPLTKKKLGEGIYIINLNVKPTTIKFPEEDIIGYFYNFGSGKFHTEDAKASTIKVFGYLLYLFK